MQGGRARGWPLGIVAETFEASSPLGLRTRSPSIVGGRALPKARREVRLRTSTDLPAEEVALAYRACSVWSARFERRSIHSRAGQSIITATTPRSGTSSPASWPCGSRPTRRRDAAGVESSWSDLGRDLYEVKAVDGTLDGQRYRLRTDFGQTRGSGVRHSGRPSTTSRGGRIAELASPAGRSVMPRTQRLPSSAWNHDLFRNTSVDNQSSRACEFRAHGLPEVFAPGSAQSSPSVCSPILYL